ncbi:MAG: hypothetical protein GC161_00165 [Planctomycetaceae bacterium]|nr:hypothetical protein [Planctomycetaceae bacterium]
MTILALCFVLSGGASEAAPANSPTIPVLPLEQTDSIWSRLRFSAEGRLRAESTFDQVNGVDRHRGRLRFRIGAEYDLMPDVKLGARISTLSDGRDANNPHWDFGDGDGFEGGELGLDRFFLQWQACEALALTGGKFAHPFTRPPVLRELAWDDDVQPAGVAAVWKPSTTGRFGFDVRATHVVAAEVNESGDGTGSDPAMTGLQGNANWKASESVDLSLGTSYSHWSGVDDLAVADIQGNTADAEHFAIWDTFLAGTVRGGPLHQTTAFAQYFNNVDDESGEDTGFAVGVQVGKSSKKDDWNLFAAYYDVDANAVFSAVAQDDTPIAGTGTGDGMEGFVLGGQYFVADNVSLKLWVLTSDAGESEDPYRVRFDIDFRIL